MIHPTTKIRKITVGENRRILAVSDIHGCASYLKNGLAKANFSFDYLVSDGSDDGVQTITQIVG